MFAIIASVILRRHFPKTGKKKPGYCFFRPSPDSLHAKTLLEPYTHPLSLGVYIPRDFVEERRTIHRVGVEI